jgi:uncharacterized membrane protein HdeD (DUF308 family)
MTIPSPQPLPPSGDPRRASTWLHVEAGVLILLGVAAIVFPLVAGIAAAVLLGWILIIIGIAGVVGALQARPHVHLGWSLVSSILALVAGLLIAFFPLAGAVTLVIVIAAWLVLDGVSSLMIALDLRRQGRHAWWWSMLSAIADWVLAALALALGPVGGAALVGFIVGIDLILGGLALLGLGRSMRRPAV